MCFLLTDETERAQKKDLLFGTQQRVIELADLFHSALPFLIVGQPEFHHPPLLRPDAELPVAATRVRYCENPNLVSLSGFAACATLAVKNRTFQQRSPQYFIRGRQPGGNPPALLQDFPLLHLLE